MKKFEVAYTSGETMATNDIDYICALDPEKVESVTDILYVGETPVARTIYSLFDFIKGMQEGWDDVYGYTV